MKDFLYHLSIFLSRCAPLFPHSSELHHARFARIHELTDMLSPTLPTDSLFLGISKFQRILHVKATQ